MKIARNQLILLGFICQALTWDDYLLPLASIILWISCLTFLHGRFRFSVNVECLLMLGGALASLGLGRALGHNTQFFIGHGLTVMQAARLLRPLNRREKIFSVLMTCLQLGVGCTFLFDLRFIPIFLGLVLLLPKAFTEIEAETFAPSTPVPKSALSLKPIAVIFAIAVVFFMVFPRGYFGRALQPLRNAAQDSGSLLDDVVDPTRSGAIQFRRVLLQIQGEKMGLLRCYCLSDFDGTRWTSAAFQPTTRIEPSSPEARNQGLARLVHVKQVSYLGRILPTDGRVVWLTGRFFNNPVRNAQDNIQCESIWPTANNTYEYKIDPHPEPQPMTRTMYRRMTNLPPQSERLNNWLDTIIGGETNQMKIARRLESYLRDNFTYNLGAPELRRLNPVDDFVFNQKQGHCERFASTLTILLRMKNIPARVVIGYLPRSRGGSENWYTVRFTDAHSWTEAWFKDTGWVPLDATPAATTFDDSWPLRDWWDTVDLAWNLHVVNFDGTSQRYLLNLSLQGAGNFVNWIKENAFLLIVLTIVVILIIVIRTIRLQKNNRPARTPQQAQIIASHYYGQMLRALAKQGFHRAAQQTPLEFLQQLAAYPALPDVQLITHTFCETRYGRQNLPPSRQTEIQQALERIKKPSYK